MASFSQFGNNLYTGQRSFDIVGRRKIWYSIAIVMVLAAAIVPFLRGGFQFGIEFRGGSEFQVASISAPFSASTAKATVASVAPEQAATARITTIGTDGVRVQTDQLNNRVSDELKSALATAYKVPQAKVSASFIGATWGADITGQALRALVTFLVFAAVGMAIYFRTWKMSVAAMAALMHDLIITAGVYGILGLEVTPAAVIGFLTILGYSLYDTVVVFDKIRENTSREGLESTRRTFGESVNLAVNQTLVRSINTSVVAILPIASILFIGAVFLGAGTLRDISLALFIGVLVGTYSTIFLAAPIYSHLRTSEEAIKKQTKKIEATRRASAASVSSPAEAGAVTS